MEFRNFCSELGIKLAFASVNHPESKGAVEMANGLIFSVVSKALFDFLKGKWA
jgi:IS30 family transposase